MRLDGWMDDWLHDWLAAVCLFEVPSDQGSSGESQMKIIEIKHLNTCLFVCIYNSLIIYIMRNKGTRGSITDGWRTDDISICNERKESISVSKMPLDSQQVRWVKQINTPMQFKFLNKTFLNLNT
jgi:hypothetical protein